MKKIITILILIAPLFNYCQDSFCNGWEEGYKNAHEDNNESLGIIPICPIPKIGIDTYRAGYNLGYKKAATNIGVSSNPNVTTQQNNENKKFCDGWEEGYKNAYEDNNESLGIIPICPIPGIHQNDSFRSGYNVGYKKATANIGVSTGPNIITPQNNESKKFCDGWEEGYKNAYEDKNEFLGITPICPIPKIGADTYRAGYSLGYKEALKDID